MSGGRQRLRVLESEITRVDPLGAQLAATLDKLVKSMDRKPTRTLAPLDQQSDNAQTPQMWIVDEVGLTGDVQAKVLLLPPSCCC